MLYKQGDLVQYKKYQGIVRFAYAENKTYIVTLYAYRGTYRVDKQISQIELYPAYEQLAIRV